MTEDELLDMQIDFADKYLPDDKEDTKRRVQADMVVSPPISTVMPLILFAMKSHLPFEIRTKSID